MTAALDILAGLVLEDGRRWGDVAHPVQWTDAEAVLNPASTTPYHYLTRARGWSKTGDLAGMAIAVMLEQLPAESRCYALAADRDQGRLLVESIAGFVAGTPELGGLLDLNAYRVTACRSGTTLDVLAADAPGAYGLRPAFLIVDELAQWATTPAPRQLWEAVTTAMAKIAGARMAVLTSAGDPSHWAFKILEHARSDPLWRTHEVAGPPPWIDPERLAEQRRRLPESSYARLFENRWTAAEDRLTSLDALRECVVLDGPLRPEPGLDYVVAVDIGLKSDRTVAAVCHAEPFERPSSRLPSTGDLAADRQIADSVVSMADWYGGRDSHRYLRRGQPQPEKPSRGSRIVLDRMQVWSGTRLKPVRLSDVEAWLLEAATSFKAKVVFDPFQAVGMMQRLQERRVEVKEFVFSSASVGRLASTLHLLLRDRALALPDDPELLDELANVRLRETSPGVLRMDHDPDKHDDRAIALAMAAHELLDSAPSAAVEQHIAVDRRLSSGRRAR